MFTVDALNQITATHAAANGRDLDADTPAILLPEGFMIQSTEHLQAFRSRFRGCLSTQSLPDFCGYVHGRQPSLDAESAVSAFVDAERMSCTAFFNLGDPDAPGHADDTATVQLKPTAAYSALRSIAGSTLTQSQLAEWMEDWAADLQVIGAQSEDIPIGVAVQKIRTITVKASAERTSSENSFSQGRSAMDSIEAAHAEQQPSDLVFTIIPYEGLLARKFVLRLSILTGDDKPRIKPRWVQQEAQEEAIAQEFKEVLTTQIGQVASLTLGTFNPGK